ncbi:Hypothetical_protein [Hexamita inflata]|uniref:Hypothetical_protein n=1 Tax=Hexamita inflata TaxID=28002 RepID=A0AA86NDI4_9EUKA|nr:Hypothetical protein HINF_LOCUS4699 [Hexamita inflata]CAI9931477.1 Hypothetical protein HINF_LOCUS19122 [Hexamita inflata]
MIQQSLNTELKPSTISQPVKLNFKSIRSIVLPVQQQMDYNPFDYKKVKENEQRDLIADSQKLIPNLRIFLSNIQQYIINSKNKEVVFNDQIRSTIQSSDLKTQKLTFKIQK